MSLRRLFVLIHYTPADDMLWRAIEADNEKAEKRALQQRLRERRDHYKAQRRTADV